MKILQAGTMKQIRLNFTEIILKRKTPGGIPLFYRQKEKAQKFQLVQNREKPFR